MAGMLLLAGCGSADADGSTTASTMAKDKGKTTGKATVVEVGLENYRFEGLPDTIKGPKVRFDAVNRGPSEHELEVIGPDGKAVGEIEAMPAGEMGSMEVNLPPGKYAAQCLVEEEGKTHAELGMTQNFTVK